MNIFDKLKNWWNNFMDISIQVDEGADQVPCENPKAEYCCNCEGCDSHKIVTLRDAFDAYILSKTGELSQTTLNGYEIIRDKHLQYIMEDELNSLTRAQVQTALDNEHARGYSEKTIKFYRSLLMKIFAEYRPDFKPELLVPKT